MAKFFDFSHLRGDIFGSLTAGWWRCRWRWRLVRPPVRDPLLASTAPLLSDFLPRCLADTLTDLGANGADDCCLRWRVCLAEWRCLTGIRHRSPRRGHSDCIWCTGFWSVHQTGPYPVVSGFMSGIGCIIIALQLASCLAMNRRAAAPYRR